MDNQGKVKVDLQLFGWVVAIALIFIANYLGRIAEALSVIVRK